MDLSPLWRMIPRLPRPDRHPISEAQRTCSVDFLPLIPTATRLSPLHMAQPVDCTCSAMSPDPDIAGIGVVIAFMFTSITSLLFSLASFGYIIDPTDIEMNKFDLCIYHSSSVLGQLLLHPYGSERVWKFLKGHFGDWEDIILPVALALNDTQLVSCLAFLITGLFQLNRGITVYHFSIVADLAWMASATQLLGFLVMITWLVKDDERKAEKGEEEEQEGTLVLHPYLLVRVTRLLFMTVEFALLACVSYIQGNRDWDDSYLCQVRCLSRNLADTGGSPKRWMIANFVLLVWTLAESALLLFTRTRVLTEGFYRWTEFRLNTWECKLESARAQARVAGSWVVSAVCIAAEVICWVTKAIVIVYSSIAFYIAVQLGWFIAGAVFLWNDRRWADRYFSEQGENPEAQWGFGQFFPLVMLILPFLTVMQAYCDTKMKGKLKTQHLV